jgi:hypothetical protein
MPQPATLVVYDPSHLILSIRGQRVIVDADLSALYGVPTRTLNQAVKRNAERFPATFAFQLTADEKTEVITICDHLQKLKFSPSLPWAFTEHGALMAATILNSPTAIRMSVEIINAFVRLRQMALSVEELARKLNSLEKKYDGQFKIVFDALRRLMEPPPLPPKPRIGFHQKD